MNKKPTICLIVALAIFSGSIRGQRFVSIIDLNEISNLTGSSCIAKLKTGEKAEGILKGLSVTTGYISGVTIKQEDGKKDRFKTSQLESLQVKSSGFTDMASVPAGTVTRNNMSISTPGNVAEAEYIVFETVNTGKLSGVLLLQLLNPGFCSRIRVYAYETDSGNTVTIRDEKKGTVSYTGRAAITYLFVKPGEKPVKIEKSNFRNRLKEIFSDCPAIMSKINNEKIKWDDIAAFVYDYNNECKR
jgi:hypothetical protein